MHINDVFAKNSKMRKKTYFEEYFFLQIRYTEEIRAVNYHFFCAEICTISAQNPQCLRKGLKPQTSLKTSNFLLNDAMF